MELQKQKIVVFSDKLFHKIDIVRMIAFSKTQEDPFYVCDIPDIVRKYEQWVEKLPRIKPFFDQLLSLHLKSLIHAASFGSPEGEIKTLLQLKVAPENIILANTIKPKSTIRLAKEIGVWCMTFDNEFELRKMKEIYPSAKLIIRIKVNSTKARVVLDDKFGCEFVEEAPRLLRLASYLQLKVYGVSFHVGSDSEDPEAFYHSIKHSRKLFDLGKSLGHDMKFVKVINSSLEEYFPGPDVLIIAEPGRYFVSSSMTLATQIQYMPCEQPMELKKCILWGPTCDSGDCLQTQYLLPKLNVEDWIKFDNFGAYTLTTCTEFSVIPAPHVFAVADYSTSMLLQNLQPSMKTHFEFANDDTFDITLWYQYRSRKQEI
ncbi:Ornithine decarboxylase 1 [Blattella germanica]|nr:Ornithine decarboxylase 1 [Blattella germanica]